VEEVAACALLLGVNKSPAAKAMPAAPNVDNSVHLVHRLVDIVNYKAKQAGRKGQHTKNKEPLNISFRGISNLQV
jgi:hypothetical protein